MPKPPMWLPFIGPPLAGVTAGLVGPSLPNVFVVILVATLVGFVPIVGYQVWKRMHHRS